MQTISLKLPQTLIAELNAEASRRQVSKSRVVREALQRQLKSSSRNRVHFCADLAADLIGSQPGPPNASTDKDALKQALLEKRRRG